MKEDGNKFRSEIIKNKCRNQENEGEAQTYHKVVKNQENEGEPQTYHKVIKNQEYENCDDVLA